jgi:uncharacterized protein
MIRAVIDTNLVVSYLLTQSETLSALIEYWEQGQFVYLTSPTLLTELREVVYRPNLRKRMRTDPGVLLELVELEAELTPGTLILSNVCRDPKDEPFLACAVEGEAAYVVTGDADLLAIGTYEGVTMIRALDFVHLLENRMTSEQ